MRRLQVCWLWVALLAALLAAGPVFAQSIDGRGASIGRVTSGERELSATPVNPVDRQAAKALGEAGQLAPERLPVDGATAGTAVNVAIGEIPVGKSISIFFDVTVNSPFLAAVTEVSNQGTVSGSISLSASALTSAAVRSPISPVLFSSTRQAPPSTSSAPVSSFSIRAVSATPCRPRPSSTRSRSTACGQDSRGWCRYWSWCARRCAR